MNKIIILQEKTYDYGWIDVYECHELDTILKFKEVFEKKYPSKTYRLVEVI